MDHRKEELEVEILEKQAALLEAKRSAIKSAEKDGELYRNALEAFRAYAGNDDEEY